MTLGELVVTEVLQTMLPLLQTQTTIQIEQWSRWNLCQPIMPPIQTTTMSMLEWVRVKKNEKKKPRRSVAKPPAGQNDHRAPLRKVSITREMQSAHIAVATASDTMYYPGRRDGEPEHCIVCLEYNKFVDPNVDGGRPSGDYTKYVRKKPLVVASGVHDDEQLTRILADSLAALKHKNKDPKDHVAVRLFRKDPVLL